MEIPDLIHNAVCALAGGSIKIHSLLYDRNSISHWVATYTEYTHTYTHCMSSQDKCTRCISNAALVTLFPCDSLLILCPCETFLKPLCVELAYCKCYVGKSPGYYMQSKGLVTPRLKKAKFHSKITSFQWNLCNQMIRSSRRCN